MTRASAVPAPQRIPRRVAPSVPAPVESPRHLRLVDPTIRRRERRRRQLVRVWAVGIVAAALLGVVVHAFMAEAQMRVGQIEDKTRAEQRRYDDARLRLAQLEAPSSIVERATRLGLVGASTPWLVAVDGTKSDAADVTAAATQPWQTTKPSLGSNP